jgi:hypothetical protein
LKIKNSQFSKVASNFEIAFKVVEIAESISEYLPKYIRDLLKIELSVVFNTFG